MGTRNERVDAYLHKGLLCSMAAFKGHCSCGLGKSSLVFGEGKDAGEVRPSMGSFGRITRPSDLPPDDVLAGYIREAMKLSEAGVKSPTRARPKVAKELVVPADLAAALDGHEAARATFEGFGASNKREYVEWLAEAKTQATLARRLGTTVEWMAEGKPRNWKYINC